MVEDPVDNSNLTGAAYSFTARMNRRALLPRSTLAWPSTLGLDHPFVAITEVRFPGVTALDSVDRLRRTGARLTVPVGKTILETIEETGTIAL
jgi:hypothetical protein